MFGFDKTNHRKMLKVLDMRGYYTVWENFSQGSMPFQKIGICLLVSMTQKDYMDFGIR